MIKRIISQLIENEFRKNITLEHCYNVGILNQIKDVLQLKDNYPFQELPIEIINIKECNKNIIIKHNKLVLENIDLKQKIEYLYEKNRKYEATENAEAKTEVD